ncbi:MAG: hypothetical protein FVQ83_14125 [Chloroflexi bacterium]|nr:hypothetical protein [Chloroflexota bacterium]
MFKTKINAIATRALLDSEFKAAIMNGQRKEKLKEFDLNDKQVATVLAIDATDLDQFIHQLGDLILDPGLVS